ncbi:hypothetical protein AB6A40_011728 [Gnathostoma spinigerum]|uniref:Uncharacterized protein n=1 Tax=Gnathostoma spinigerum TaxID=75299 RepID=A0ABD6EYG6_9BILA
MKWIDDGPANRNDLVPLQEQFAFCFNTILSDLAAQYPSVRDQIVSAQLEVLACCTETIISKYEKLHPIHRLHTEISEGDHQENSPAMRQGLAHSQCMFFHIIP